ncbi:hypothetical protein quinque_011882 [Culex quinquefasciatus]
MSPPAKNLINDLLPIELFDQIFSHLTPTQQFTAMTTCIHWFQILGHDRYRRRLLLNPSTLTDDLPLQDLHWMKQFRLIAISDCGPFGDFPHLLTEFVDQELRDHVEDLQFGLEWIDWEDFLRDSRWPALRTLTIEAPRMEIPDAGEMRLIAPNLRKIEVADVTESVAELVQGFCDQLEEVCTVVRSMKDFEFIFGKKVFGKLRSVALKTSMWMDSEVWTDRDLTEANLKMFSGLRHLKVTDWEEKFKLVLPTIFGQTTELDTLTIKGCAISSTSVRQISKMKNLRMLNLSCKVEETAPISLPLLQKLTTCYGAALPVEAFVVLSMALAIASCAAVEQEPSKKDKRGLWELADNHYGFDDYAHHHTKVHHHTKEIVTKHVDRPYPVEVIKHVDRPYPVEVIKHVDRPYPVEVVKKVPYPVEVIKKVPVHVDRPVPYPVEVPYPVVQKEFVEVPKPYAVHVEKPVPVLVEKNHHHHVEKHWDQY